jgi:predicted SnoaL-like aldol condensation-catalyzing enzyme
MAKGDMLMLHGRFSGIGQPANWIVVDIVRLEDGRLAEHWDVVKDEATCNVGQRPADVRFGTIGYRRICRRGRY